MRFPLPGPNSSEVLSLLEDGSGLLELWFELMGSEVAVRLLRAMSRARQVDEGLARLQRSGRIGFHGSTLGQEAVPAAFGTALLDTDWIVPGLRESSVLLHRGMPLVTYLMQSFAKQGDIGHARQMPGHQFSHHFRVASWSSCIGTQLPHAVGLAWAAKLRGERTVVVGACGDGATSTPDFHAALNFAGVFRVPVVFVCQNNRYAISLPVERQSAAGTLAQKGASYGLLSYRVDGNDALAVHAALTVLTERARAGLGASFLECVTYRRGPHSSSDDPTLYRPSGELLAWTERDPITRLRRVLTERGVIDASASMAEEAGFAEEFEGAVRTVEGMPEPRPASLFEGVYARLPWHLVEQRWALLSHKSEEEGTSLPYRGQYPA